MYADRRTTESLTSPWSMRDDHRTSPRRCCPVSAGPVSDLDRALEVALLGMVVVLPAASTQRAPHTASTVGVGQPLCWPQSQKRPYCFYLLLACYTRA